MRRDPNVAASTSASAPRQIASRPGRALIMLCVVLLTLARPTVARAQPGIASVQLNKSSVVGGNGVSVDITLDAPAPGFGQQVTLSYSTLAPMGQAPKTVTVPGGQVALKVAITTRPVAVTTTVAIVASIGSSAKGAQLVVSKPELASATLSRSIVQGGDSLMLAVTLDGDAPAGGLTMSLSFVPPIMGLLPPPNAGFVGCSSGSILSGGCNPWPEPTPQSLTFAAGTRQLQLALLTPAVRQTRTVTVRPSLGVPRSLALEVRQPRVNALEFRQFCRGSKITSTTGPGSVVGVVQTTDRVSKDGAFATLSGSSTLISIPPTVEFTDSSYTGTPANALEGHLGVPGVWMRSGCFPIAIPSLTPPAMVPVTAAGGGQTVTATLKLTPLLVSALQVAPTSARPNEGVDLGVKLTGVAGAGGTRVRLTSSHPSIVPVPAELLVPSGESIAGLRMTVGTPPGTPGTSTVVTITAELGGQSRTTNLQVIR